jgi:hypothetical protein
MMRAAVVELDDGTREWFDDVRQAYHYAKEQEQKRRHSVEYLAIANDFDSMDTDVMVLRGQELRITLRSVDNIQGWITGSRNELESQEY